MFNIFLSLIFLGLPIFTCAEKKKRDNPSKRPQSVAQLQEPDIAKMLDTASLTAEKCLILLGWSLELSKGTKRASSSPNISSIAIAHSAKQAEKLGCKQTAAFISSISNTIARKI